MNHVIGGVFFMLVVSCSALAQTANVATKPVTVQLKNVRVQRVLVELAIQSEVSIGFERSDLDVPQITLSVDQSHRTVRDVLNHIVKEVPIYRWEMRDGVVNMVPVRGRSRVLEDFLSINVREFKANSDLNKFDLRNYILDLPEVELYLKVNNLKTERLRDYPYRPSIYAKDVDLSIAGTDVLGILNNIVSKGEHHLWMLSHDGDGTLYLGF
jgi:hypothetical protein